MGGGNNSETGTVKVEDYYASRDQRLKEQKEREETERQKRLAFEQKRAAGRS